MLILCFSVHKKVFAVAILYYTK